MSSLELVVVPEGLATALAIAIPQSTNDLLVLLLLFAVLAAHLTKRKLWDRPDPHHHLWFERPQLKNKATRTAVKATRNIAQKMAETHKSMVVFWGSQSGTSEGFANRVARDIAAKFGVGVMSADLSDYDPETITLVPSSALVLFILSTFGEGDPSDNTQTFWDWATSTQDTLSQLRYVAFGLGNSNYKYYNRVVDTVTGALEKLGATALMSTQKADDANGSTEEDFLSWRDDLYTILKQSFHLQEKEVFYQPTIATQLVENTILLPVTSFQHQMSRKPTAEVSVSKHLRIQDSRELFKSSSRHCIHLDLDITDEPELRYKTGDHLAVFPLNLEREVETMLTALGLNDRGAATIQVTSLDSSNSLRVPASITVEGLFKHHLEICAPISRDTLRRLEQFAPSEAARRFLNRLSGDKNAFAELLSRTYLTLGRLLTLAAGHDTVGAWENHLPLSWVIETLPTTQPRYYSISSSSITSPRHPSITALVSKNALPGAPGVFVHGVTSNYLRALHELHNKSAHDAVATDCPAYSLEAHEGAPRLYAQIRRSKFKLPAQATTPIIMVAAGTGIAPFRAFVEERSRFAKIGREVGEMLLFFGCRRSEEDFLYREEIEGHRDNIGGGKMDIVTAFSRVDGVYVQDRVREEVGHVMKMLENGAYFYICGRAAMAREVGSVVQTAMMAFKRWSDAEIKEWSEGMKRRRVWQEDVWG